MPSTHIQDRLHNTGQIPLPVLGLYSCKTRVYSPTLGRFLQTDPIGYEDQVNLYAYVGNDPVNLVDPTGLSSSSGCGGDGTIGQSSCRGHGSDSDNPATIVSTHRIKAHNSDGSVNRAGVKRTTTSLNKKIRELTENSGFTREYAVIGTLDVKSSEFVFAVLEGPKTSSDERGTVNPGPYLSTLNNHRLFYGAHTHKGLGDFGSPFTDIADLFRDRGTEQIGPSPDDKAYSRYIKEEVRPYARFYVFFQLRIDSTPRPWLTQEF